MSGNGPGGSSARSFAPAVRLSSRFSSDMAFARNLRAAKRAVKLAPDPGAAAPSPGDADLAAGRGMSRGLGGACRPIDAVCAHLRRAPRCDMRRETRNVQKGRENNVSEDAHLSPTVS